MFDFASNMKVGSIEVVPEEFRALYVETDGDTEGEKIWKLNDGEGSTKAAVSAIVGLNQALKASRAEAKASKGKTVDLKPLKDLSGAQGDGVEEISAAIRTKIQELEGQLASGKTAGVNIDKIKADLAAAHKTEIESRERKEAALTDQLYGLLVEQEAVKAMGDTAVNPALLLPFIKQQLQPVVEDGKYKVLVIDSAGDRRFSGVTGVEMSVKELVDEMRAKADYQPLFRSQAKNGSGAPTDKVSAGMRRPEPVERSSNDKIKAGLAAMARR